MDHVFRLAVLEDYEAILLIFKDAIRDMCLHKIDQWDEIYPNEATLLSDITKEQMYLLAINSKLSSAIVLNEEQDEEYKNGNWAYTDGKIAVIHRLCVHPDFQNVGVGKETMSCAEQLLFKTGYKAIRLDAFMQNPKAIHFYNRMGYKQTGKVIYRKGEFFLFEKQLQSKGSEQV